MGSPRRPASRRHQWLSRAVLALVVLFLASLALAQSPAWDLGPYRLLTNAPSSPPLRYTMSATSLTDAAFVGGVGGVAFASLAEPRSKDAFAGLRVLYDASRQNGERLVLEIGGRRYPQTLPDWILIPVARYAASDFNACVSLFGPEATDDEYDLVYHEAFKDTLLGLRLLQADILFFDLGEMWRLPSQGGKPALAPGEVPQGTLHLPSARTIGNALGETDFQSWVLTDAAERVEFDLVGGKLRFSGSPYYYFWKMDSGEQVVGVDVLTNRVRGVRPAIRQYNPAVYVAAELTMHYAAFFRWVKQTQPEAWRQLLNSLPTTNLPALRTPTRWTKPK